VGKSTGRHFSRLILRKTCSFDFEKIWPIYRHVAATNIAKALYIQREKFRLITMKNQTGAPLITADQPIINTHAVATKFRQEV